MIPATGGKKDEAPSVFENGILCSNDLGVVTWRPDSIRYEAARVVPREQNQ